LSAIHYRLGSRCISNDRIADGVFIDLSHPKVRRRTGVRRSR